MIGIWVKKAEPNDPALDVWWLVVAPWLYLQTPQAAIFKARLDQLECVIVQIVPPQAVQATVNLEQAHRGIIRKRNYQVLDKAWNCVWLDTYFIQLVY